jgi:hypothetical protein
MLLGGVAACVVFLTAMGIMLYVMRSTRAEISQARDETRQLLEQVSAKEKQVAALSQQREEADAARLKAEAAQRNYEWLVKNVDPNVARIADAVTGAMARRDDPQIAIAEVTGELIMQFEENQRKTSAKPLDFTPEIDELDSSPRPDWVRPREDEDRPPGTEEQQIRLLADALLRRLASPPPAPPSTQPTTSQPATAASQPVPPPEDGEAT